MASRLQDVLLRGTSASRPLATAVANGTLYYSTDLGVTEQSDGTTWLTFTDGAGGGLAGIIAAAGYGIMNQPELDDNFKIVGVPQAPFNQRLRQVGITVDGGGVAITTGVKGYFSVPWDCTIISNRVLADQAGSIVFDVWKDIFANYPPTVVDTITAAAKPTLTAQDHTEDTTLTGWTKTIRAGDVLGYKVDSATTVTRVSLHLILLLD